MEGDSSLGKVNSVGVSSVPCLIAIWVVILAHPFSPHNVSEIPQKRYQKE